MERIYVVEDDDNIRDLIRIALEGFGYSVSAFEMAEDALKSIETDMPDLAVFDLMLCLLYTSDAAEDQRGFKQREKGGADFKRIRTAFVPYGESKQGGHPG